MNNVYQLKNTDEFIEININGKESFNLEFKGVSNNLIQFKGITKTGYEISLIGLNLDSDQLNYFAIKDGIWNIDGIKWFDKIKILAKKINSDVVMEIL